MLDLLRVNREELNDAELLKFVAPEAMEGIIDACSVRSVAAGELLLSRDQPNSSLYIILSGRVRIHLACIDTEPIAYLEKGEVFGELSVIDRAGASAYVVADGDCRLLVMTADLLWSLVRSSHAAACNLLQIVTRRLRQTNGVAAGKMELENGFQRYGTVDALTGLHNRYWLDNMLPRLLYRVKIREKRLSVIMMDLDRFKEFNDRHGHVCGDQAIHLAGRLIMENLRPTEMAARYGGDEFVILLPDVDREKAKIAAERLRKTFLETRVVLADGSERPALTVSLGVAEASADTTAADVVRAADLALFRAKEKGRNCVSE